MIQDQVERWRDGYLMGVVAQLPSVDASGKLSGQIPGHFKDFIVYPPNPTMMGND
jgi:hypothetical protein